MTLAPELTIGERYTLVERVAVGGMGEVWRARDVLLGRDVALKVLKEEYAADPAFLQRFRNEAKHTAGLSHPGIANVFDYGEIGDMAFLVMELVAGEPLSTVLAREGPLPPERTLDIVGQVGLALQAAHDGGVVHRDVKPGNLLIRPDGVVKVTDFGIARAIDAAPVTQTGLLVGTAAYLSPEQAAGRPVTAASDIYSLGVVAYECLAGRRPFAGDSAVGVAMAHISTPPPALPRDVPPLVNDFVMRALDKDPARRQSSAGDFGRTALALAAQLREPRSDTLLMPEPTATTPDDAAPGEPTRVQAAQTGSTTTGDPDAERRRIRNIFVAIGAAVVVIGFLLLHSCTGSGTRFAVVPKVTGKTYQQAASTLQARGFEVRRHDVADLSVARGIVLAQSVHRGARIPTSQPITLDVSSGPAKVAVNEAAYVGRPVADVSADLIAKNLLVQVVAGPLTAPAGTVTGVDPTGSVREGTTVTVTVAAEPTPPPDKHGQGKHKGHGD
ncbi:MAG: eukaryotic-like serine/threonine-protein kinase [Frankiaceae bacterium]|nr:eukaryotic-like serine/threonine-protein kinase [Frankiaceae bacterium]